jgi:two-component system, LytTR family, sensor kinase
MKIKNLSIVFQLCFWVMILALQMAPATSFLEFRVALLMAGVNTIMAMTMFYVNSRWLFPSFFEKKKFGLYVLINLGLLILLSHIFVRVDGLIIFDHRIHEPVYNFPPFFHYMRMVSMLIFVFFISLVFSLIRKVQVQDMTEKQLAREKMNTEIRLLKAQINPHFIFNSMNNIYSLAYSKSDQAPEAVLKLSDMLRYVYYDCNRDEVTLGAELEYIRNYIAFQQMKSPQEQHIVLDSQGVDENFRIAPMLFIPFVENSFKYSKIEDLKDARVEIKLITEGNELLFKISNTHPENGNNPGSGLGIENVNNRLKLTYPGKFELKVKDEDNIFVVEMKIDRS